MQGVGVTTVMVAVQCLEVGLNTLIKAATTKGMSNFVFVVYSNAIAQCFLLPSSFIYHRKRASPPITSSIICRIFLLSLILMYTGIRYSSPTLASAMVDLTPAFTFMLAIVSRMEKLDLKLESSQAKSIGTVVSIAGALIVTLYKGLPMPLTSGSPQNRVNRARGGAFLSVQSDWLLGGLLLSASSFFLSLIFILKTWIIKDYPAELMVTTISCSFVVILSTVVALIAETSTPEAWVLRPDMELVAILYSAVFVVSMRSIVHIWACRKRGPVYVSMFTPLGMVIALAMGIIFLGDTLYLGRMIGAAIIALGFYGVIWGQAQEKKLVNEKNGTCNFVSSSSSVTPLLQNESMEV